MEGYFVCAPGRDPAENLAREAYLLRFAGQTGSAVLYLWQNDPVVVIGRNQCAYTECDLSYVRRHGIPVVRRLSGGGAVYHDAGNLNFSILLPRAMHDVTRSMGMAAAALQSLGVDAQIDGRNDICVGGKKISGNAWYCTADAGLHHGTILLRADHETMERALTVSACKTAAHGVPSVRARVGDLASAVPQVTLDALQQALCAAFVREYDLPALQRMQIDAADIEPFAARLRDDAWNYARVREYTLAEERRFSWGTACVSLQIDAETLTGIQISSDAADAQGVETVLHALRACLPLTPKDDYPDAVQCALRSVPAQYTDMANDIHALLVRLWTQHVQPEKASE